MQFPNLTKIPVCRTLTLCILAVLGTCVAAGPVADRVRVAATVRICIWPDYYGVTFRSPRTGKLAGIDVEMAASLSKDLGVTVQFVDSSFATFVNDLNADRCDVAMFAIGVTPQRAQQLSFSKPYLQSDIYGVTSRSSRVVRNWTDIDKPGVLVAVQAGTIMEPVMASALKQAKMVVVRPPQTREQELEAGRVDVFMTDFPYSRRLLDNADWARLVSPPTPFSPTPYAYAVKQGDAEWLALIDEFLARAKRDGRLESAARNNGLSEIVILK